MTYLGLWGDSSDNIPGVPSIGEKKVKLLMKQFDSIEEIIENTDKIESASIRKAIEENKDKAILSKQLATIILDVPIDFDEDSLLFTQPNFEHCKKLFSELEFKTFEKRFFNEYAQMEGYADYIEQNYNIEKTNQKNISSGNENQLDLFGNNISSNNLFKEYFFATLETTEHNYKLIEKAEDLKEELRLIKEKAFVVLIAKQQDLK